MLKKRIIIHADIVVNTDSPSIAQARYEEISVTNNDINLKDDGIQLENIEIVSDDEDNIWRTIKEKPKAESKSKTY